MPSVDSGSMQFASIKPTHLKEITKCSKWATFIPERKK
ncbi:hypothetical protein PSPO01_10822 [Paraphaeosphaeria sporulosa]